MSSAQSCNKALIIGSRGRIASALVQHLIDQADIDEVHTVSRSDMAIENVKCSHHVIDSADEKAVGALADLLATSGTFSLLICCIGQLHGDGLKPEKRLEAIHSEMIRQYFDVNTLAPLNWIKQLPVLMHKSKPAHAVFFSARVGSIEDNHLGGWYGYRASKAALNMLLKTAQIELQRRLPDLSLVSYHPGTVDSPLSAPYQKGVPEGKLFSPEFTVSQLMRHLPALVAGDAPHFIDWKGETIPW